MTSTYFEEQTPRSPVVSYALGALVIYLALFAGFHLLIWAWGANDLPAQASPALEIDPAFPAPQVLHHTPVTVGDFALTVPYQGGIYEIVDVLPPELTVVYRDQELTREAQVVVFARPQRNGWRMLAPFPAARLARDIESADDLIDILRVGNHPSLSERIFFWRLVGWYGRRQLKTLIAKESGDGRLVRLWLSRREGREIVGREYENAARPGRLVAVSLLQSERQVDFRFAFDSADPKNMALINAYLEAVRLDETPLPDNERDLMACEQLPVTSLTAAARLCREVFLVAQWTVEEGDLTIAQRLYDVYRQFRVPAGLAALQDVLSLTRDESPQIERLVQEIEETRERLAREDAAAALAEVDENEQEEEP
ncbi:MAG TPA: hypothetical protein PK961_10710 [bacterium]|nr:hypothetical protein [bacterium]